MQKGGVAELDVRVTFVRGGGCANQGIRLMKVVRGEEDVYICSNLINTSAPCDNSMNPRITVEDAGNCSVDCKYNIRLRLNDFNESDAGTYVVMVDFASGGSSRQRVIQRIFDLELDGKYVYVYCIHG